MDLRKSASDRRYFVTSEGARKRFLPCFDGAHVGFDTASLRVASAARWFGRRGISFWVDCGLVAATQARERSCSNLFGNHHGRVLLRGEYSVGRFWALLVVEAAERQSSSAGHIRGYAGALRRIRCDVWGGLLQQPAIAFVEWTL